MIKQGDITAEIKILGFQTDKSHTHIATNVDESIESTKELS